MAKKGKSNKNLVGLAKDKTTKSTEKKEVKKPVEEVVGDEVTENVKRKVNELISSIPSELKNNDEVFELEGEDTKVGNEWLEEQIDLLSQEVERLRKELAESKGDYKKLHEDYMKLSKNKNVEYLDTELNKKVVAFFDDVQTAYMKMGKNLQIVPPAFLNRMVTFFPFLKKYKKF